MRNYVKLRAVHFHAHGDLMFGPGPLTLDFEMFSFGMSDADLMEDVLRQENERRTMSPSYSWVFSNDPVIDYYFKLDKAQILDVCRGLDNSASMFNNTIPWSGNPSPGLPTLSQQNLSPRSTWPTSSGTDGQRLRSGKAGAESAAAAYIAKLWFLTSNPAFKRVFDDLRTKKITAKEALAIVATIVKT